MNDQPDFDEIAREGDWLDQAIKEMPEYELTAEDMDQMEKDDADMARREMHQRFDRDIARMGGR